MRTLVYGAGVCIGLLSILFFLVFPKTSHSIVSFLSLWFLLSLALCFDCRKEQLRKERIQRNINTTTPGFLQV